MSSKENYTKPQFVDPLKEQLKQQKALKASVTSYYTSRLICELIKDEKKEYLVTIDEGAYQGI